MWLWSTHTVILHGNLVRGTLSCYYEAGSWWMTFILNTLSWFWSFLLDIMKQFPKEPKTFTAGPPGSISWRFLLFLPWAVIACGRMHTTAVHGQALFPKQIHPWQLSRPWNRSGSPQPSPISDSLDCTVITPLFFQGCFYYLSVHLQHYSILLSVFELNIHGSLSVLAWCIFSSVYLYWFHTVPSSCHWFLLLCGISLCDCAKNLSIPDCWHCHFQLHPIL